MERTPVVTVDFHSTVKYFRKAGSDQLNTSDRLLQNESSRNFIREFLLIL